MVTRPHIAIRRIGLWCGVAVLALSAIALDGEFARTLAGLAALALLVLAAPVPLRALAVATLLVAVVLCAMFGARALLDAMPALISAFIAGVFARSLRGGRIPLIARAIAALDGAEQLRDPAVARYARRLTVVWAVYQVALATVGVALAWRAFGALPVWPSPRLFGVAILPAAVVLLFAGEFFLRPFLLPQAPRRRFVEFAGALVGAWPALLDERAIGAAPHTAPEADDTIRESFRIAASHPALPGHFPGHPVVPGVVLLDHVAAAIEREWGLRVVALHQVKFRRPLTPERDAELVLARNAHGARFEVAAAGQTIATGALEINA